jgi:RecA-family ATPase
MIGGTNSKDGKNSGQSAVCVADIDYLDIAVNLCEPEAGPQAEADKDKKVILIFSRRE